MKAWRPWRQRSQRLVVLLVAVTGLSSCYPSGLVAGHQVGGTVGRPSSVVGRDVGVSAKFGGQVTWIFGDTIFAPASCDGLSFHTATAAIDPPDGVVGNVIEPVDKCGAPFELFRPRPPKTTPHAAFWPEIIVPTLDGRAAVFYQQVLLDDKWTVQATRVVEVEPGATMIDRTNEVTLFGEAERSYNAGGLVHGGYLYLYATELQPDRRTTYHLARVPHGSYRDRVAYTFWDGARWVTEERSAAPLALGGQGTDASGGLGGLTVSYNEYLKKYLMVHSVAWGQDLVLRTADSPTGPWSKPSKIDVPDSIQSQQFGNYSAREHPEFASDNGRHIVLTYHRTTGWLSGELRIVRVTLR